MRFRAGICFHSGLILMCSITSHLETWKRLPDYSVLSDHSRKIRLLILKYRVCRALALKSFFADVPSIFIAPLALSHLRLHFLYQSRYVWCLLPRLVSIACFSVSACVSCSHFCFTFFIIISSYTDLSCIILALLSVFFCSLLSICISRLYFILIYRLVILRKHIYLLKMSLLQLSFIFWSFSDLTLILLPGVFLRVVTSGARALDCTSLRKLGSRLMVILQSWSEPGHRYHSWPGSYSIF